MKVYFSGIEGTGLGPLALMAKAAGMEVVGSDLRAGAIADELTNAGIRVALGQQDGKNFLAENKIGKVDWLVASSAIPAGHPEVYVAEQLGIKVSKRDEFIAYLVEEMGLKMVAVAGTHGKTSTTAMIVWTCLNLGIPISYLVGTTLGFTGSGKYTPGSQYLIYEADEYDKNFLKYHPWLSVVTAVSYDHPDTYPTQEDYTAAFEKFKAQSAEVIEGIEVDPRLSLAGEVRRYDATLAMVAVEKIVENAGIQVDFEQLLTVLNEFPGVGRRFERIADGIYSDYAHHPEEIAATIQVAREEAEKLGKKGVVAVYEPHQNTRQHKVREEYRNAFEGVDKLYWLPTYLTREDASLAVIQPSEFIAGLSNAGAAEAEAAEANADLAMKLKEYQDEGYLVLLMTAGPADEWLRRIFKD